MPLAFKNAEAFADSWFQANNPAAVKLKGDWPLERMEEARNVVKRLVRGKHADGKEIYIWAILGVGKKQTDS